MRTLIASAVILSAITARCEVDYSRCAEFFNNLPGIEGNEKGWRTKKSGPFVPPRLRHIAFDLRPDGTIAVHQGARKIEESDGEGNTGKEIIIFRSPTLESLEALDPGQLKGSKEVKAIIERNIQGHITSITENVGLVAEEDEDREIERIAEWNGGDAELAFAYKGTRTEFKVAANECVPMESKELLVRTKNEERQEIEIVVFDTKLCRKIREFFNTNPTVLTFDDALNGEMAGILATDARELIVSIDERREFLSNAKVNELVNYDISSTRPRYSLRIQALTGYMSSTQMSNYERERHGISPIISAYMILGNCYSQRLDQFYWNQIFWNEDK